MLDIFFPLALRLSRSNSLIPCENQTRKDLRPNLFLTSKFDPQGLTVASRTIVAREKLDAPDSTKTSRRSPRSSAQISAKRVQFGLQSHFSCLLATPLDVKYTPELFTWFACIARARVCKLCTIIHNFQTDWAKSFGAQPKSTAWQVGARTWSAGGRSFIGRLSCFPFEWLCALCVSPAWMHCCTKKLKSILWQQKRLNESSIPVKYKVVPN